MGVLLKVREAGAVASRNIPVKEIAQFLLIMFPLYIHFVTGIIAASAPAAAGILRPAWTGG
jgi:hypothetical protein